MELTILRLDNDKELEINTKNYQRKDVESFLSGNEDMVEVGNDVLGHDTFHNANEIDIFIENLFEIEDEFSEKEIKELGVNLYPHLKDAVEYLADNMDDMTVYPADCDEELGEYLFDEVILPEIEQSLPKDLAEKIEFYFDFQSLGRDYAINNNIIYTNGKAYEFK